MDSDKNDEDEQDALSKQIVDYYKKYSQNKHLPKYFSGTSLSYMPQIVKDEEIPANPLIVVSPVRDTLAANQTEQPPTEFEGIVEPKPISPTSSVTSNRKLEWDNGADIGYINCNPGIKLHKSISLPIILGSGDNKTTNKALKTKLSSQIVTIISYSSPEGDVGEKQVQSSSSSSSYKPEVPVESSSSSSFKTNVKPISSTSSSFTSTVAYLKSKIGTPDAESTPKLSADCQKPYTETPFAPKKRKGGTKNKIINLCTTKPILIECLDRERKKGSDKKIQTSIIEGLSKCVQTTDSLELITEKSKNTIQSGVENQSIIFISYDSESDRKTCSSNNQTDIPIVASRCDSFEYYRETDKNKLPHEVSKGAEKSSLPVSTDSSKEIPLLSQLITERQSKNLIGDVDKSIELLQKLLKSKKYDPVTKKRYIKKIVEKIVDSKYKEDSTTSSELFIPKKIDNSRVQQKLQENIPWYPPQISKFTVKTFSDEFLPNENKVNSKKSVFNYELQDIPFRGLDGDRTDGSLEKQQTLSSGSYHSWKDDKTFSERLLEGKQQGQGDQLVKFAMKERQHQIAWIKDEISHLTKLKGLLEKKVQTTTVYMVSQHFDHQTERNSCSCSDSQRTSSRNYVIQTELSASTSSDVPIDYNIYDKFGKRNYQVRDMSRKSDSTSSGKIVGEIEVVSDDDTTNIKVKTTTIDVENNEDFKPKPPILIGPGKYDTFPKSKVEEGKCWPCGMTKFNRNSRIGLDGHQQYSFDVPLEKGTKLHDKVNEIVNKYANPLVRRTRECKCSCKCKRANEKIHHQETQCTTGVASGTQDREMLKSICKRCNSCKENKIYVREDLSKDSELLCICCKAKNIIDKKSQTENTKSKAAECTCCHKQVQTCICVTTDKQRVDYTQTTSVEDVTSQIDRCNCCQKILQQCICNTKQTIQPHPIHKGTTTIEENNSQTDECKCCQNQLQKCICNAKQSVRSHSNVQTATIEDAKAQTDECSCCQKQVQACICDTNVPSHSNHVQTATIEDAKAQTDECNCCDKEVQASIYSKNESIESRSDVSQTTDQTSTSSASQSITTTSESMKSCLCCKRKNVTTQDLYVLKKKLSDQAYPLCRPCYRQNRGATHRTNFYYNPAHVCTCYTVVQTKTLNDIKKTINDLNDLDNQYCTCVDVNSRHNSTYCKYCKCKLKKTSKSKNGIAYMLTFENESLKDGKKKKKHRKKPSLEEIKIKIPVSYKKKHKDKENKRKKAKESVDSEETNATGVSKCPAYNTLQEYLNKNRPGFVELAEGRRKTVNNSKIQREEMSDRNKLQFLKKCQEQGEKNAKQLFSAKEMKDITRRNYQKLPEVQQRLMINRERNLRQANRLMADTFNKKLRENVLKGKRNLPTDVNVVNL